MSRGYEVLAVYAGWYKHFSHFVAATGLPKENRLAATAAWKAADEVEKNPPLAKDFFAGKRSRDDDRRGGRKKGGGGEGGKGKGNGKGKGGKGAGNKNTPCPEYLQTGACSVGGEKCAYSHRLAREQRNAGGGLSQQWQQQRGQQQQQQQWQQRQQQQQQQWQQPPPWQPGMPVPECGDFKAGRCTRGASCRFVHVLRPAPPVGPPPPGVAAGGPPGARNG
jgi:hypothetical protein